MAEALYRKYRPQRFADVSEQEHVIRTVTNQIASGKTAQAYLFAGPRGVGKTTIARLLAKSVQCEGKGQGEFEPCGACAQCVAFQEGRAMDILEVDAASQTGVDNVRENIIENVRFAPTTAKFKVFIIDEVHMLSTSSFNALLKTLEEPPKHAVFILATTELHKIPATILSRCQRFDFRRIPEVEIMKRLQKIAASEAVTVDDDVTAAIAKSSEGCLRDAESLFGQLLALGEQHIGMSTASLLLPQSAARTIAGILRALSKREAYGAMNELLAFTESGGNCKHLADELAEAVRDTLYISLGDQASLSADPELGRSQTEASKALKPAEIGSLLDLVLEARFRSTLGNLPQAPLEIAFVRFCYPVVPVAAVAPIATPSAPVVAPVVRAPQPAPAAVAAPAAPARAPMPSFAKPTNRAVLPPSAPNGSKLVEESSPRQPVVSSADGAELPALTLDDVKDKWGRCISVVAEKSVAVSLLMKTATVADVSGGRIILEVPYAIHAEKFKDNKTSLMVCAGIETIVMRPVHLEVVLQKREQVENTVDALLGAFGGNVV
ncbi:DNA polymerase III subunit gamma/tau [Patescibacteria group bacterium]|nr:DNA polymerase III subunit gamma/tau [Patescibacteria group bacterium]